MRRKKVSLLEASPAAPQLFRFLPITDCAVKSTEDERPLLQEPNELAAAI